jgi:hypothetical protein
VRTEDLTFAQFQSNHSAANYFVYVVHKVGSRSFQSNHREASTFLVISYRTSVETPLQALPRAHSSKAEVLGGLRPKPLKAAGFNPTIVSLQQYMCFMKTLRAQSFNSTIVRLKLYNNLQI